MRSWLQPVVIVLNVALVGISAWQHDGWLAGLWFLVAALNVTVLAVEADAARVKR